MFQSPPSCLSVLSHAHCLPGGQTFRACARTGQYIEACPPTRTHAHTSAGIHKCNGSAGGRTGARSLSPLLPPPPSRRRFPRRDAGQLVAAQPPLSPPPGRGRKSSFSSMKKIRHNLRLLAIFKSRRHACLRRRVSARESQGQGAKAREQGSEP